MHVSQINYPENFSGRDALFMQISNYPDHAIQLAREIADIVLGTQGAWHFISLEFISPMARGLGDKMDQAWLLQARAILK